MFLPRRASNEKYDDVADERRGTNILIRADETFSNFKVRTDWTTVVTWADDVVIGLNEI